jgi:signal transduction histidine kinase
VAHEINNPLGVISGYAEIAAKNLERVLMGPAVAVAGNGNALASPANHQSEAEAEAEAEALSSAMEAQTIIRDEAFRCKEITSRLLSLARGGGDGRENLKLDEIAKQVATLTRGLRNYRDRQIVLDFKPSASLEVVANPTEMKQVFMNLTVNALEAGATNNGQVRIGGQRYGNWVELFVEDTGKGMTPEMVERVFEPFFTAKRGAGEPGTGLGLSITHAIVESHGGRIEAQSRGPGKGSRFTVRLPARAALPAA